MDKEAIRQQFFELEDRKDVAAMLGISDRSLRYFLYKRRPENMYRTFQIPKKNGRKRTISAPNKELREIQRKLSKVLTAVYEPKICAYGFIPSKNIVGNADQHTKKNLVLNIDLKDFFGQIHFGRIQGMLLAKPYSIGKEAATVIAQIACLNGTLPQGAPSSPILTNMVCAPLDNALMRLAKKTGSIYTRYADDITFSTFQKEFDRSIVYINNQTVCIGSELSKILEKHSFEVNTQKIYLRSRSTRQEVTGLTVNEFPNLRRSYIKQLRAIMHSCEKYGVLYAAKVYIRKGLCKNSFICSAIESVNLEDSIVAWFRLVLIGKINYIKQVKGDQSLTYLSFAKKFNELFSESKFDLTHLYRFEKTVNNSTFILKHEKGENYFQGSAFYLQDLGLFTCYHVTESGEFFDVFSESSYPDNSLWKISKELNEIASNMEIDYALYKFPLQIDDQLTFNCGDSRKIRIGDQVTIIGYPNHDKGNSPFIQPCCITSKKTFQGAPFYTVSGRIVHGASGGIVLNTKHEAIGIIKGGIVTLSDDDNNENQGFVPLHLAIEHIKSVREKE